MNVFFPLINNKFVFRFSAVSNSSARCSIYFIVTLPLLVTSLKRVSEKEGGREKNLKFDLLVLLFKARQELRFNMPQFSCHRSATVKQLNFLVRLLL